MACDIVFKGVKSPFLGYIVWTPRTLRVWSQWQGKICKRNYTSEEKDGEEHLDFIFLWFYSTKPVCKLMGLIFLVSCNTF